MNLFKLPKNNKNLKLHCFKSSKDCFANLKIFVRDLKFLKVVKDIRYRYHSVLIARSAAESSDVDMYTVRDSMLLKFLKSEIDNHYSNFTDHESYPKYKVIFAHVAKYITEKLMLNDTFFPITEKCTKMYYLNTFVKFADAVTMEVLRNEALLKSRMLKRFYKNSFAMIIDSFERDSRNEVFGRCLNDQYFFKFLNQEMVSLENHFDCEKILCDFYNMLSYIVVGKEYKKETHAEPNFKDNSNCRILKGLRIELIMSNKLFGFKAYDPKNIEVQLQKGQYIHEKYPNCVFLTIETIKSKNVAKIQLLYKDVDSIDVCSFDTTVLIDIKEELEKLEK